MSTLLRCAHCGRLVDFRREPYIGLGNYLYLAAHRPPGKTEWCSGSSWTPRDRKGRVL